MPRPLAAEWPGPRSPELCGAVSPAGHGGTALKLLMSGGRARVWGARTGLCCPLSAVSRIQRAAGFCGAAAESPAASARAVAFIRPRSDSRGTPVTIGLMIHSKISGMSRESEIERHSR